MICRQRIGKLLSLTFNFIVYRFNLIRFSGNCEKWQENIQPATQENCHSAIKWASTLKASGNTCTLEALQVFLKTHYCFFYLVKFIDGSVYKLGCNVVYLSRPLIFGHFILLNTTDLAIQIKDHGRFLHNHIVLVKHKNVKIS
jgi:hypothetical protein